MDFVLIILGDPGADNGPGGSKSGKFTSFFPTLVNFHDLLPPAPLSVPGFPRMCIDQTLVFIVCHLVSCVLLPYPTYFVYADVTTFSVEHEYACVIIFCGPLFFIRPLHMFQIMVMNIRQRKIKIKLV